MDIELKHSSNGIQAYFYQGNELIINLIGEIGWEFDAKEFLRILTQYKDEKIKLNIYSPGGNAYDALAVHDYIKSNNVDIEAYLYGFCASAATVFACAAKRVYMAMSGLYLVHNAWKWDGEDDETRLVSLQLAKIYHRKTGKPLEEIQEAMNAETFYTAQEAFEMGFIDEVIEPQAIAAAYKVNFSHKKNNTMAKDKPNLLDKILAKLNWTGKTEEEITALLDSEKSPFTSTEEINALVEAKLKEFQPPVNPEITALKDRTKEQFEAIQALTEKVTEVANSVNALTEGQEAVEEIVEEKETEMTKLKEMIAAMKIKEPFAGENPPVDTSAAADIAANKDEKKVVQDVTGSAAEMLKRIRDKRKRN